VASTLQALRVAAASPHSSIAGLAVPPELVDYLDAGRNPDVYTREFVELTHRGNAVLAGKQAAFAGFADVLAQELRRGVPGVRGEVDRVMGRAGMAKGEGVEGGKEVVVESRSRNRRAEGEDGDEERAE